MPTDDETVLSLIEHELKKHDGTAQPVRLANFCHVTSRTATKFPAEKLTRLLHQYATTIGPLCRSSGTGRWTVGCVPGGLHVGCVGGKLGDHKLWGLQVAGLQAVGLQAAQAVGLQLHRL